MTDREPPQSFERTKAQIVDLIMLNSLLVIEKPTSHKEATLLKYRVYKLHGSPGRVIDLAPHLVVALFSGDSPQLFSTQVLSREKSVIAPAQVRDTYEKLSSIKTYASSHARPDDEDEFVKMLEKIKKVSPLVPVTFIATSKEAGLRLYTIDRLPADASLNLLKKYVPRANEESPPPTLL